MLAARSKSSAGKSPAPLWLRALLFGLTYFLSAESGRWLSPTGDTYVSFWLPAGWYVAALLLHDRRDWRWLVAAAFPANLLFDVLHGTPWLLILLFYCANTIQAVLGAWLVQRFVAPRITLNTVQEFVGLLTLAGIVATLPGALIGAGGLHMAGLSDAFLQATKIWWGSCVMAVLLGSPLVLVWCQRLEFAAPDRSPAAHQLRRIFEGTLLYGGLLFATWELFVVGEGVTTPYKFRVLPFLLWAGLRFGRRGAATANFIFAALVVYSAGHSPTALPAGHPDAGEIVFTVQTFLAVAAMVGLIPAIAMAERDETLRKLRESEEHYRHLTEAAFEGVCVSENGRVIDVSDQLQVMFAQDRGELLGHEMIEFVAPESREAVTEAIRTNQESPYVIQLLRKDGSSFYCEVRAKMVRAGARTLRMTALRDITARKQAEEALRLSEEKFSKAFLASPSAMVITRQSDGLILEANEAFCHRYNVAPATVRGRTMFDVGAWQDQPEREALLARLRSEGAIRNVEKEARLPSGRQTAWLFSLEQINIHGAECLLVVTHDITDLKLAQRAVQENETKFRTLFDAANDAIFIMDRLTMLDCNRMTEIMFGCHRDEIIGYSPVDFSPEKQFDDIPSPDKAAQKIAATYAGQPQFFEWLHRRRDGTLFDAEVSLNRVELGGKTFLQAIVRDITLRKRAEEDLRESQRALTTLMANLPGLVYRCRNDADWTMEFVSAGCFALTGYQPADLLHSRTTSFAALIHPEDRNRVRQTVELALQRRAVFELTYRIRSATGLEKWVWERGQGVYSSDLLLLALEGFITDVTAQHQAEVEREAATKREQTARAEFTRRLIGSQEAERTRIAREIHDHLGQLLTALKLDLRSLERRAAGSGDAELKTALTNKINSARELADETISSVQKIASELRPGILDRLGLAAAIEVEAQAFESRTGVRCYCVVPRSTPAIPQDRAIATYRIFQEIITNIARHAHATEVTIALAVSPTLLQLTAADNGVGLQPNHLGHAKSLGLIGMKERAEILGGQIEFSKPGPRTGTVVTLRLPLGGTIAANT